MRPGRLLLRAVAVGGLGLTSAVAAAEDICLLQINIQYGACLEAPDAVAACTRALSQEPRDFASRAGLCEAHARAGDFDSALSALEAGRTAHRGDGFVLGLIDRAISNVKEKSAGATKRPPDMQTLIDYMVLRCVKLKNEDACDEALEADPANHEALAGKADLLLAADDSVAAILAYRRSLAGSDNADVRARLGEAEARRAQRVQRCLAGGRTSSVEACRGALLAGEPDEYDIHLRIGEHEVTRGALSRAIDAYENARRARATNAVASRLAALQDARRCLASTSGQRCQAALAGLPDATAFAGVRADVALAGCRAMLASGEASAVDTSRPLCDEARRRATAEVSAEIDRLVASATPAPTPQPAERPVPPEPAPPVVEAPRASECLALAGQAVDDNQLERAMSVCEREIADAATDTDVAALEAALGGLRARDAQREFARLRSRCLDAGDSEIAVCEQALAKAPADEDVAALRQKIATLRDAKVEQTQLDRVAGLRSRCVSFSMGRLDDARAACLDALEEMPDDAELASSLTRVRKLIGANRNVPLLLSVGVEAITY